MMSILQQGCLNQVREHIFLEGNKILADVRDRDCGKCEGEYDILATLDQEGEAFFGDGGADGFILHKGAQQQKL